MTTEEQNAERRMVRRLLKQLDAVLAQEDPHVMRSDGEALTTFGDLREQIRVVERLPLLAGRIPV